MTPEQFVEKVAGLEKPDPTKREEFPGLVLTSLQLSLGNLIDEAKYIVNSLRECSNCANFWTKPEKEPCDTCDSNYSNWVKKGS